MLTSIPVCAEEEEDSAFEKLKSAAPKPNENESEIISIFSDHFQTQMGVSIEAKLGREIASTKISSTGKTDKYVYVDKQSGGQVSGIVFNEAIDATDYNIIHVDLFCCATSGKYGLRPRIKLVDADGGGGSTVEAYKTTLGTAKEDGWTTYEVKISDLVDQIPNNEKSQKPNVTKIKAIWFYDAGGGTRSFFVDNIYFKKTKTGGSVVTEESAKVPVYDIKWASLCLPFNAQVPKGVSAYYAQSNEGTVVLKMIGDVIPAKTAVVINAEENTDGYVFEKTTKKGEVIESNLLEGTTAVKRLVENENYVLGGASENGTPVFKLYSRLDNGNNNMYLEPYKSYIPVANVPAVSGARTLNFVFDNVTAVDAIENVCILNKGNYNMSGQRVNENYKGLVIKNGKKVVVE